jgi:hypothetical protein
MSKTTNPLKLALEESLVPAGFARNGDTWYRSATETVQVVNLQKSAWGEQYYLNVGLWFRALGEQAHPKEQHCHVRTRVEDLLADGSRTKDLLDLDVEMADVVRKEQFAGLVRSQLLPFFDECRTIDGVRPLYAAGRLSRSFIRKAARTLLESGPTGQFAGRAVCPAPLPEGVDFRTTVPGSGEEKRASRVAS